MDNVENIKELAEKLSDAKSDIRHYSELINMIHGNPDKKMKNRIQIEPNGKRSTFYDFLDNSELMILFQRRLSEAESRLKELNEKWAEAMTPKSSNN